MQIVKNKWSFLLALILLAVLLLIGLYFLKGILPPYANDFSTDIIAVLALVISVGFPLYEKLFPRTPLKEYSISPLSLDYYTGYTFYIKIRIINSGEVDINVQFEWLDFGNERFVLYSTKDEKKERIDSSIILPSGTQKDFYVAFRTEGISSSSYNEYREAANSRDSRLIESFRHIQARVAWSDVSTKMQQKNISLGAWLIEYLERHKTY